MTQTKDQVWLITGCDKGLGYAIAEAVLKNGGRVAATVLNQEGGLKLSAEFGDRVSYFTMDVRDGLQVNQVVKKALAHFGQIDVLVNNAGFGLVGAAEETSEKEYRALFEVNFFGMACVTQAVLPIMRVRRSGHIICMSSLVGMVGMAGFPFYSASKFAVEGYCEALSEEVASFGMNVTMIEPGGFRTDFAGGSLAKSEIVIDDYSETSGMLRNYLANRNGEQPGDPRKLGEVLCKLATLPSPPVRLQLGADSLAKVTEKFEKGLVSAKQWKDLTLSTSFDQN